MTNFPTIEQIKKANKLGRQHRDGGFAQYWSWRNPTLNAAYVRGIEMEQSLDDCEVVKGWRFGVNTSGLSHNHASDESEYGLSLAGVYGREDLGTYGHMSMAMGRQKQDVEGLLIPDTGSDGEPLVFVIGTGVEFE